MKTNRTLIDGHAHLNELPDITQDLKNARESGVAAVIGVGMDMASNRRILEIARAHQGFVFPAVGYHPWEISRNDIDDTLAFVAAHRNECIAFGEVGLDYKATVKKNLQREVLREIITLAVHYDKILILHCRYSHQRVFDMISEGGVKQAVFHWYTGSLDLLRRIIEAGYHISATPALVYSPPHQDAVREAPIERILLETDCPVAYQGRESRPADVLTTAKEVARLKGMTWEEVARITTANTIRLFGLPLTLRS
jgi:TatD DNase family protein